MRSFLKRFIFIFCIFLLPSRKSYVLEKKVGLTSLVGHRFMPLYILNLYSLFYHTKRMFPIYIVDDGSLTRLDYYLLEKYLHVKIESKLNADKKMLELLKSYPYFKKFRFSKNTELKMKFDTIILAPFKKFIHIDADILFCNKPEALLSWIENSSSNVLHLSHTDDVVKTAYDLNEQTHRFKLLLAKYLRIKLTDSFAGGLICFPKNTKIALIKIERIMKLLYEVNYFFNEHMVFGVTFHLLLHLSRIKTRALDPNNYNATMYAPGFYISRDLKDIISIHLTPGHKLLYLRYLVFQMIKTYAFRPSKGERYQKEIRS